MIEDRDFHTLEVTRHDYVLRVVFAHPDNSLNLFDRQMHDDVTELFRELRRERAARAVLLTARGRCFSGGGHHDLFRSYTSMEPVEHIRLNARSMISDLLDLHLPVVCAVNGPAIGLGCSIALLSDIIFIAESAYLSDPHATVGVAALDGAPLWPLIMGPARAKQYLFTGDRVSPPEALQLGLVNGVIPDLDLDDHAMAFAQRLAAGSRFGIQYTKLAINKFLRQAFELSYDVGAALEIVSMQSDDHREALTAFQEKRESRFTGR